MKRALIFLVLLSGCGINGTQRLDISNSEQNVSISFAFLDQIERLCKEQYLPELYPTPELYNQAIANCVFQNVSTSQIAALQNQVCKPGADLSSYTTDQITQLKQTCQLLGFTI